MTIAAAGRAEAEGFTAVGGMRPESAAYRDEVRSHLIEMAARGGLVVPMARTYPLRDAAAALELLAGQHPGGGLAERLPKKWRRRELNPRPQSRKRQRLRAYPALYISRITRHAGGVVIRQSA